MSYAKGDDDMPDEAQDLHHQRMAIGGADHLHKAGHISEAERDKYQAAARAKLAAAKGSKGETDKDEDKAPSAPAKTPQPRPFGMLA